MKGVVPVGVLLACLALAVSTRRATPEPPAEKRAGVFSTLRVGQAVTLRERSGLYEIGVMDGVDPQTHKLTEVGDSFVAAEDAAGLIVTRIPVSAVRAVVHIKVK